jgi:hypothetical protein
VIVEKTKILPMDPAPTSVTSGSRRWKATPELASPRVFLVYFVCAILRLDAFLIIMWQLCKEFFLFLKQEKKWWLIPLIGILLVLAALIVFSTGSVLAPFMYPFL